ncbi:MAG: hypothetical protein IJ816_00495 [Alloprevotella sp.]|nr:hypothetical protein [Alloprevotella sp.]
MLSVSPTLFRKNNALYILASAVLLLLYGIYLWRQAIFTPWVGDDIEYLYVASGKYWDFSAQPVLSFDDLMQSQWNHYFSINGRTPVHVLIQVVSCFLGLKCFAIMEVFVGIVLLMLIIKYAGGSIGSPRLIIICLFLLLLPSAISITPVLQLNYVWAYAFVLCFLMIWEGRWNIPLPLGCIMALFAGWMQESVTIGLAVGFFVELLWRKEKRMAPWLLFLCFSLGLLFICLSPAAWQRASEQTIPLSSTLIMMCKYLRVTGLFLVILSAQIFMKRISAKDFLRKNCVLLTAIPVLLFFNIIIGVQTARQLLGAEFCSTLLLMQLVRSSILPHLKYRAVFLSVLLAGSLYIMAQRWQFVNETQEVYTSLLDRAARAEEGATLVVDYEIGGKPWPDTYFLSTIEKKIYTDSGRTVHFEMVEPAH